MRFVLCIVIAALLPATALAAKGGGSMSLSSAQAAAAKGDQKAAAALATTTDRETCHERLRLPWSFEKSMRHRLPAGPLPSRRRAALLRVEVSSGGDT